MQIEMDGDDAIVADFQQRPSHIGAALVRTMRRALTSGRAALVPLIAKDLSLKARDVRDALLISVHAIGQGEVEGRLSASSKRIPLSKFSPTGPLPSRGRGKGVSYRIGGRRQRVADAFLAQMRSGHQGVFRRIGTSERRSAGGWSKNLPIVELHGPSVGRVFAKFRPQGVARVREAFEQNLTHELTRRGVAPDSVGPD